MNVSYPNGSNRIYENVTSGQVGEMYDKMTKGEVQSFSVYNVGEVITQPSGDRYEVQRDGSWRKLTD